MLGVQLPVCTVNFYVIILIILNCLYGLFVSVLCFYGLIIVILFTVQSQLDWLLLAPGTSICCTYHLSMKSLCFYTRLADDLWWLYDIGTVPWWCLCLLLELLLTRVLLVCFQGIGRLFKTVCAFAYMPCLPLFCVCMGGYGYMTNLG